MDASPTGTRRQAPGIVLNAEVRVGGGNRLHRERLCRYLLRPPQAKTRLHEAMEGKQAWELKTP
ncbi:MAG: transposase [Acidobacteria bacterium]|nr:transposase [Acidobacteriota bacterium]